MNKEKNWTGERLEPGVFNETTIEHLHRYAFASGLVQGKKVLDIACGEGYGANLLAARASQVTGVDINANVIEQAKIHYKKNNLEFLTGTVDKIPSENSSFDVVVCFETIEHVSQHDIVLREIKRVLNRGGLLFISTPDKKNYTDKPGSVNPHHVKELYTEEFKALLGNYFSNIQLFDQQISFSSVISSKDAVGFESYRGNFNEVKPDDGSNRLYNIAMASDGQLPQVKNSLFNGQSVFAEAVREKENQVINTITYKTGNIILYPAKWLRRLFQKNKHD